MIVDRQTWGASAPRMSTLLDTPVDNVFLACVDSELCQGDDNCFRSVQRLQMYQVGRINLPDIQYNFCVCANGRVYEGRGWHARATLLKRHRQFTNTSLYVGFLGSNFDEPGRRRERGRMLRALDGLLHFGVRNKFIKPKFLLFNTCKSLQMPNEYDYIDPYDPKIFNGCNNTLNASIC